MRAGASCRTLPVPILHRRLARRFRFAAARSAATASEPIGGDGGDDGDWLAGRPESVRASSWRQCIRGELTFAQAASCTLRSSRDCAVGDACCGGAGGGTASAAGAVTAGTFGIADAATAIGEDARAKATPEAAATLLRAAAAPTRLFLRPGGSDARVAWRKTGLGSLMAIEKRSSEAKRRDAPS